MSEGIRSGVNWIRLKDKCSVCDNVETRSVFARPGTPTSNAWLRVRMAISTWSTTASWPTMTLANSALIPPVEDFSSATACRAWSEGPSAAGELSSSANVVLIKIIFPVKTGRGPRFPNIQCNRDREGDQKLGGVAAGKAINLAAQPGGDFGYSKQPTDSRVVRGDDSAEVTVGQTRMCFVRGHSQTSP